MKIAISGINGFIGSHLKQVFESDHHSVIAVPRELASNKDKISELSHLLSGCDVLINLSGAPLIHQWTTQYKQTIYNSRILITANLVGAMKLAPKPLALFISTSAVGIYEAGKQHNEYQNTIDKGFLGKLCVDWENEALIAGQTGCRVVIMRLSVVLGRKGGVVKKLYALFKSGLGAVILPSRSAFPFVHIDDLTFIIKQFIENRQMQGVYNVTTDITTTQKTFARAFAHALRKPLFLAVPGCMLRLLYGKGARIIINNPFVESKRLKEDGYVFKYQNIHDAMIDIAKSKK